MKLLAILQILCFLLLSSVTPMTTAAAPAVKSSCCEKMEKAGACKKDKKATPDNCGGQGCSMMLTCGICGFLPQEPVALQPAAVATVGSLLSEYQIGNVTGYSTSDWKPPKV